LIVRCASCNTEFSLDDRQVGPEGATVRCSVCSHVFQVGPPGASLADQPWQIRTVDDLVFTAPNLETLRDWIGEGRLHPDDKISRTGKHWVRLGDMPEFSDLFGADKGLPQLVTPVAPPEPVLNDVTTPPPASYDELTGGSGATPASMLDVVTKAVSSPPSGQPILGKEPSTPAIPAPPPFAGDEPKAIPSGPPISGEAPVLTASSQLDSEDEGIMGPAESVDDIPVQRGGISWKLMAGLGVFLGVALVFGVPGVRSRVMGLAGDVVGGDEPADPATFALPEQVQTARKALEALDTAAMARAEAALQAAIDDGKAPAAAVAAMKLAQVEILTARSVELAILAAADGDGRDEALSQSQGYADQASRIFDDIAVEAVQDRDRLKTARAMLRLAQGRGANEIEALLPKQGAQEAKLAIEAAVLWRDPEAKAPEAVVSGLRSLDKPTGLSQLILTLAHMRAGAREDALTAVDGLLRRAPDQPTAAVIKGLLAPAQDTATGTGEPAETATEVDTAEEEPKTPTPAGDAPRPGGRGGGTSTERMIDQGCSKVEGGDPRGGVKLLMKAFDIKPGDLDVLVCLAQGYSKLGNLQSASAFYKRALKRSPRHRSALRGAAKTAAKLGQTTHAVKLYERLLDVEPSNKEAKDYVSAHGGQRKAPSGGQPPPGNAPAQPMRGGAPKPVAPPGKAPSG
jgi:predicted Zn finger-like uncharacterized protein